MSGCLNAGDFGCCGSWAIGCGVGKGCMYCATCTDPIEQQENLLFAMNHCNVFKKLYIQKDAEFTKAWMDQFDENGKLREIPVSFVGRKDTTTSANSRQVDSIVSKLSGTYDDAAIADLLKLLNL